MTLSVHLDASGLGTGLADAGAEITRVAQEEIAPAAQFIENAFASAARTIASDLSAAALSGEFSLKRLGRTLTTNFARSLSDTLVRKPIENLLTTALSAPFGGARADGGLVAPGRSYLVGERGPELFTPGAAGRIGANARGGGVNVSISLPGVTNAESFQASETQIAAGLMRALSRAERNQ
ncbi:MAG: phage tail tape measure protein [Pseudomonadota bacterium]